MRGTNAYRGSGQSRCSQVTCSGDMRVACVVYPPKSRSSDGEEGASGSPTSLRRDAGDLWRDGRVVGVLTAGRLAHRVHRHYDVTGCGRQH